MFGAKSNSQDAAAVVYKHGDRPADTYSPVYFLAALGTGGIAVDFFMYLMFWIPHPGRSVPVFEDIADAWAKGFAGTQAAIVIAMGGILVSAFIHLKAMVWNLRCFIAYRKTPAYDALRKTNNESTLLAMPLAMAMSVNVIFIVFLVYIPGLWSVVEYIFPLALVAFSFLALLAFSMIAQFMGRVLVSGDEAPTKSFAQLTPAFAVAMIAVGFAAPAAMSSSPGTVVTSMVFSTILGVFAILYTLFGAIAAFSSMLHYGTTRESVPTLMIIVPIVTVLGIMFMRQDHGLYTTYDVHAEAGNTMIFLARMLSIQLAFMFFGAFMLRAQGYFQDFVFGQNTSPGSYALVCPFVAMAVMIHFFANKGLVAAGAVTKFDGAYWFVSGLALASQAVAIALVVRLNMQHFGRHAATSQPSVVTAAKPSTTEV